MTGRIHSFETFGTADGPGIRFVAFMQGCRFRCLYCHNPDTWALDAGTPYEPDELAGVILRYKPYFESSGGGVTVSGGEPLLQSEFLCELFTILKRENIHTCLDTNGNHDIEGTPVIGKLLSMTDLVLLDIKHMNPDMHTRLTEQDNSLPLAFAKELEARGIPVWLRYVVVPGYTDAIEDIAAFKSFASSLSNVEKIEFLPFHKFGEYKWGELNLPYQLKNVSPPGDEFMNSLNRMP